MENLLKRLLCTIYGGVRAALSCWRVATLTGSSSTTPALEMQQLQLSRAIRPPPPGTVQLVAFTGQFCRAWADKPGEMAMGMSVPPAPPSYENRDIIPGQCPLCDRRPQRSPTALATSGYVFCFSCIVHHIQKAPHGQAVCPVTRLPASLHQLVRIYSPQSNSNF